MGEKTLQRTAWASWNTSNLADAGLTAITTTAAYIASAESCGSKLAAVYAKADVERDIAQQWVLMLASISIVPVYDIISITGPSLGHDMVVAELPTRVAQINVLKGNFCQISWPRFVPDLTLTTVNKHGHYLTNTLQLPTMRSSNR